MQQLIENLTHIDEVERLYAVEDLAALGTEPALQALSSRLELENSRVVRDAIVRSLSTSEGSISKDLALRLLHHDEAEMRNAGVYILRQRATDESGVFVQLIRHSDPDIRKLCLDILSEVNSPFLDEVLEPAFIDSDVNVVITAVEVAGKMRRHDMAGPISNFLAASPIDPMLLACVLDCLARIGNTDTVRAVSDYLAPVPQLPDFHAVPALRVFGAFAGADAVKEVCEWLRAARPSMVLPMLDCLSRLLDRFPAQSGSDALRTTLRSVIEMHPAGLARMEAMGLYVRHANDPETPELMAAWSSTPQKKES